jgi:hypothetical protein
MAAETHKMLKEAFGDNALRQTQTYVWFKHFKNRRISVDDEEHSGCSSTRTMTENVAINARGYPGTPKTNNSRCLQHCQTVIWKIPVNFV